MHRPTSYGAGSPDIQTEILPFCGGIFCCAAQSHFSANVLTFAYFCKRVLFDGNDIKKPRRNAKRVPYQSRKCIRCHFHSAC